jgi:hypothetical protein
MRAIWPFLCLAALGCAEDFVAPSRPDLRKEPPDFAVAVEPRDLAFAEAELGIADAGLPLDLPRIEADLSIADLPPLEHPDLTVPIDLANLDL